MSIVSDLTVRIRSIFRRGGEEHEMDEEVRFHIEREIQQRLRGGEDAETARRQAMVQFGNVEHHKEDIRDARGTRPLENLVADIRYALRGLRRNPAFTLTGILVLGIGIGATATVYSIVHSVVLADLPYPEPERLVRVVEKTRRPTCGRCPPLTYPPSVNASVCSSRGANWPAPRWRCRAAVHPSG